MNILRFVGLSSLFAACVFSAAGQSSTMRIPAITRPAPRVVPLPAELQMFPTANAQAWQPAASSNAFQQPLPSTRFAALSLKPRQAHLPTVIAKLNSPNSACYTMRSYNYTRDTSSPDMTTLSGSTTCQSSAQFQVRNVSPVIVLK